VSTRGDSGSGRTHKQQAQAASSQAGGIPARKFFIALSQGTSNKQQVPTSSRHKPQASMGGTRPQVFS